MRQRLCLDCDGRGTGSRVRMQNGLWGYTPCPTCDSAGYVDRTGPYRLADGTWSDGVDRSKRIWATYFAMRNRGRWHVYKATPDFFTGHEWRAYSDRGFLWFFKTHAEAIAYADRTARTTKNGDAS